MKTTLKILIEKINESIDYVENEQTFNTEREKLLTSQAYKNIICMIDDFKLLDKERNMIIDSYADGKISVVAGDNIPYHEYFNKKWALEETEISKDESDRFFVDMVCNPKEEPTNCPKCRTTNFKNCHSIYCPMRKKESKQTVQEYEQQGLEKYSHELEPKQETLEDAAKDFIENTMKFSFISNDTKTQANRMFKCVEFGAKWQQEQNKNLYSEEEVRKMFDRYNEVIAHRDIEEWQPWIDKQFKKK